MLSQFCRGSQWRRWDLHFHTPASFDYLNKDVTNEEIIQILLNNKIEVVAITDHHVMDTARIRELQKLGQNQLTVLPGIELRSELGGSESVHYIGIFSEHANIEDIWTDLQSHCKLKPSDIKTIGDDKIYCDFRDTANIIHRLGGIVTVHAGGKSNTIESIKNNHLFKQKLKSDLVRQCIDVFELGAVEDQDDYNDIVFPMINVRRPMVICSDNHDIRNYSIKEKLWIKADPTFEGLRQILHEPIDRVRIQSSLPEDKPGYQVIDRIEVSSSHIYGQDIHLNSNLNSIIGGRSAGKSVLLAAVARKLKTDKPVKSYNAEYDEFVADVSLGLKVIWKDQEENNQREIEYFEQGYMYELARKDNELSQLVERILKRKGKESLLNSYERFLAENKREIGTLVSDMFRIIEERVEKQKKATDKGDKKGIEEEINKLEEELKTIQSTEISGEERSTYTVIKQSIESSVQRMTTLMQDKSKLQELRDLNVIRDNIELELTNFSEERRANISAKYDQFKRAFKESWEQFIQKELQVIDDGHAQTNTAVANLKGDPLYIKVSNAFSQSSHLVEMEQKLAVQKNKLFDITILLNEIVELKAQQEMLKLQTINAHKRFYEKTIELLPGLSEATDGLEIKAKAIFHLQRYREILSSALNLQGQFNQALVQFAYKDDAGYEVHLRSLVNKLLTNDLALKGGYTNQSLMTLLLTECFYNLKYDIEYDGDDFAKMSDGKKAFVVLKLLLDFSDKECPIFIDQPEDDLDNRAIYQDLVQYLKKKKKVRQILVATHNPNIVVGADSELIIAANQDGIKNFNRDRKKFQYVSGSLEHTCEKNALVMEILEAQGIREHICEILEGGNEAFRLRERKYSLPEPTNA